MMHDTVDLGGVALEGTRFQAAVWTSCTPSNPQYTPFRSRPQDFILLSRYVLDAMLSRFRSRSPLPPAAAIPSTTDALDDAIKSFQNCLEPEQKMQLEAIKAVPDAHAVAQFTHQLDQENAKRKSRCVAARISPLLESIQQFAGIVETFVSSNPRIAALVWGSVKLVLQVSHP